LAYGHPGKPGCLLKIPECLGRGITGNMDGKLVEIKEWAKKSSSFMMAITKKTYNNGKPCLLYYLRLAGYNMKKSITAGTPCK
jgi:hypothetical protein